MHLYKKKTIFGKGAETSEAVGDQISSYACDYINKAGPLTQDAANKAVRQLVEKASEAPGVKKLVGTAAVIALALVVVSQVPSIIRKMRAKNILTKAIKLARNQLNKDLCHYKFYNLGNPEGVFSEKEGGEKAQNLIDSGKYSPLNRVNPNSQEFELSLQKMETTYKPLKEYFLSNYGVCVGNARDEAKEISDKAKDLVTRINEGWQDMQDDLKDSSIDATMVSGINELLKEFNTLQEKSSKNRAGLYKLDKQGQHSGNVIATTAQRICSSALENGSNLRDIFKPNATSIINNVQLTPGMLTHLLKLEINKLSMYKKMHEPITDGSGLTEEIKSWTMSYVEEKDKRDRVDHTLNKTYEHLQGLSERALVLQRILTQDLPNKPSSLLQILYKDETTILEGDHDAIPESLYQMLFIFDQATSGKVLLSTFKDKEDFFTMQKVWDALNDFTIPGLTLEQASILLDTFDQAVKVEEIRRNSTLESLVIRESEPAFEQFHNDSLRPESSMLLTPPPSPTLSGNSLGDQNPSVQSPKSFQPVDPPIKSSNRP